MPYYPNLYEKSQHYNRLHCYLIQMCTIFADSVPHFYAITGKIPQGNTFHHLYGPSKKPRGNAASPSSAQRLRRRLLTTIQPGQQSFSSLTDEPEVTKRTYGGDTAAELERSGGRTQSPFTETHTRTFSASFHSVTQQLSCAHYTREARITNTGCTDKPQVTNEPEDLL